MAGRLYYWVANWNLSRAQASRLLGGAVDDMADCIGSSAPSVVKAYPAIKRFGVYVTGGGGIAWTAADRALLAGKDIVALEIDQSNSDLLLISHAKMVKDDEPGASTPEVAVHVAAERLRRGDDYIIYVAQGGLDHVENLAAAAGLPHGEIVAYQWASPSSNPDTLLPGTGRTLKEANADLTVVRRGFLPLPTDPPARHGPSGTFHGAVSVDERGHWTAHGTPSHDVELGGPADLWWASKVLVNRRTGQWRIESQPAEHHP
jgi:hypothetical protein